MEIDSEPRPAGSGFDPPLNDTLLPEAARNAVLAELDRILNSTSFRTARRSQEFLRYVVLNALDGHSDLLKERTIGASIFQRAPDYDTGEDSIVRVKASELRKRLAQYYMESGPDHEVVIEVPAGAYVPEFRWPEKMVAVPPPPTVAVSGRRTWTWRIAGLVLILSGLGGMAFRAIGATDLDRFWEPVLRGGQPVLICVAHPVVYSVRSPTRELLSQGSLPEMIPATDLTRDPDNYVGFGDAFALAQISGFLSRKGRQISIRMGNDTSFADLRAHPAVLIGAFTNQWTMQLTSNLRYVFDRVNGVPAVRDQMDPKNAWVRDPQRPLVDYVIVSRLFDSRSGDVVVTAAGLAHAGTYMAGEFLTNPAAFEQALREAPPDWARRNLQLVITGEILGKTPGPPKVVASWYW